MNCHEVETALDGYLDGEFDPIRNQEIERHLQGCARCSTAWRSHQALQKALGAGYLYFKSPVTLRRRIRSSLRHAQRAETLGAFWSWRWAGIAASLTVVAILTWRVAPLVQERTGDDVLVQEVTSSHVRSLMVGHLLDAPSSDRHVVKPWFTGKIDFSPPVVDLTDHGFSLIGGRLDYLNKRTVAAIVYKRREHVINLFIWPASTDSPAKVRSVAYEGYHHVHWAHSGMTYWAISDLNNKELQEFVRLLQN